MGLRNVRGRAIGGKAEEDAVRCMSKEQILKIRINSSLTVCSSKAPIIFLVQKASFIHKQCTLDTSFVPTNPTR